LLAIDLISGDGDEDGGRGGGRQLAVEAGARAVAMDVSRISSALQSLALSGHADHNHARLIDEESAHGLFVLPSVVPQFPRP
jgi:hypothetical protein